MVKDLTELSSLVLLRLYRLLLCLDDVTTVNLRMKEKESESNSCGGTGDNSTLSLEWKMQSNASANICIEQRLPFEVLYKSNSNS